MFDILICFETEDENYLMSDALKFNKSYLEKYDIVTYHKIDFKIPSPVEYYLRLSYGDDWNTFKERNKWDRKDEEVWRKKLIENDQKNK